MADGVMFWVAEEDGRLSGVMGIQDKGASRVWCATRTSRPTDAEEGRGDEASCAMCESLSLTSRYLIGTWAERVVGYRVLSTGTDTQSCRTADKERTCSEPTGQPVAERQIETSVVLADRRWMETQQQTSLQRNRLATGCSGPMNDKLPRHVRQCPGAEPGRLAIKGTGFARTS